ncbi:E3 ubiquitin-protein ligase Midline-1-like [Babylonia areolata]|uniref:E3 ubiquitin-protein ligase Midline-1-like n=1 Tax=Babylonia areolata TaxID=304850 RepID=UPI003FD44A5D
MDSAAACDEPSEKECSVCHELFTDPKLLPCGHLLCRQCLLSWITSKKGALCPMCRSPIVDAQTGIHSTSWEEIADRFPTDLSMKRITDAENVLNNMHGCHVCEAGAAFSMCLDCQDVLCEACSRAHHRIRVTRNHRVEPLSTLTAQKLASCSSFSACDFHNDEPARAFCVEDNASICMLCAVTEHRHCVEVVSLERKTEEAREVLHGLTDTLSQRETEVGIALKKLDERLKESEEHVKTDIHDAEQVCDRLDFMVKNCRHRLAEMAQKQHTDVQQAANYDKASLLIRKGRLTLHKQTVARAGELNAFSELTRWHP